MAMVHRKYGKNHFNVLEIAKMLKCIYRFHHFESIDSDFTQEIEENPFYCGRNSENVKINL